MKQRYPTNWLSNVLALIAVLTLMLVVILGVGMGMNMDKDSSMAGCLFMFMNDARTLCPMSALEHVANWQKLFNAIPALRLAYMSVLILLLPYILPSLLFAKSNQKLKRSPHALVRENTLLAPLNYLILAFSQGLLHPKIY